VAPLVILGWLFTGPMRPGWAARAGTPAALLASGNGAATRSPTAVAPPPTTGPTSSGNALTAPFTANLTGTIAEAGPDSNGNARITIDGTLGGGASGHLHVELQGPADAGGGVEMASSAVTLGPPTQPALYKGQITQLRGTSLRATVTDAANRMLTLRVALQIDPSSTHVTGTVQATQGGAG
jgi:hypothetical protein